MRTDGAVLILTPMKDAARHLDPYFEGLRRLSYPKHLLSLGFIEGDSIDDTAEAVEARLPGLRAQFASANLWRKDFGFRMPPGVPRWEHAFQLPRRKVLARARNHLLFHALEDHDWVLWLDVDVNEYPRDLIEQLIAAGRDIIHPHCVRAPGGDTFDLNAWAEGGALHMQDMRGGPDLVRLDAVGGTALLVRADLHRDGLIFPPFPYGAANPAVRSPHPLGPQVRGELETEGLGIMAQDMGHQCWGMPNLEIVHALEPTQAVEAVPPAPYEAPAGHFPRNINGDRGMGDLSLLDDPDWRPKAVEGVEINEMPDGYILYQSDRDRVHYLNPTAVILFALCTGRNRVAEMPELLRTAFNLASPPAKDIRLCLEQLLAEKLIV